MQLVAEAAVFDEDVQQKGGIREAGFGGRPQNAQRAQAKAPIFERHFQDSRHQKARRPEAADKGGDGQKGKDSPQAQHQLMSGGGSLV